MKLMICCHTIQRQNWLLFQKKLHIIYILVDFITSSTVVSQINNWSFTILKEYNLKLHTFLQLFHIIHQNVGIHYLDVLQNCWLYRYPPKYWYKNWILSGRVLISSFQSDGNMSSVLFECNLCFNSYSTFRLILKTMTGRKKDILNFFHLQLKYFIHTNKKL